MKRIALAASIFATPALAHTDGSFHAHSTDYTALAIGLSVIALAAFAAQVRK